MSPQRDVDVLSERRCWRCLQMFACPPEDVARAELDFWLCDACRTALVPDARRRR